MNGKWFHLGDALSVITGRLVSPKGMDGVCELLTFMVGEELWTHQLPRVADECRPCLIQQFPALSGVKFPGASFDMEVIANWLQCQIAKCGETLYVCPLPETAHVSRNPLAELAEMVR